MEYTFTGAGEVFSVVRPEMSKEMERKVREEVRACPVGKGYYKALGLTLGRRLWYNSHEGQEGGDLVCPQAPLGVPPISLTQGRTVSFTLARR